MSSTTASASRNNRSWSGQRGPNSASTPSTNAVSEDITMPHPCPASPPALTSRKIAMGTSMPPIAPSARHHDRAPIAELTRCQLAADLQAEHQEEHGHRGFVDDVLQVEVETVAADVQMHRRAPEPGVGVPSGYVGPDQREHGGQQQRRAAAGFVLQEPAHRRGQLRRGEPQRRAGSGRLGHPVTLTSRRLHRVSNWRPGISCDAATPRARSHRTHRRRRRSAPTGCRCRRGPGLPTRRRGRRRW